MSLPPKNHLCCPLFKSTSMTESNGFIQDKRVAPSCPQNVTGSWILCWYSLSQSRVTWSSWGGVYSSVKKDDTRRHKTGEIRKRTNLLAMKTPAMFCATQYCSLARDLPQTRLRGTWLFYIFLKKPSFAMSRSSKTRKPPLFSQFNSLYLTRLHTLINIISV